VKHLLDESEHPVTPSLEEKSESPRRKLASREQANAQFQSFLAALAISLGAAIILMINVCICVVCSAAQCCTKQVKF
jgi:hypothetical protein